MSDQAPQFESTDIQGSTSHFNGTVGTTAINIPSSATTVIDELAIECMSTSPVNSTLLISFDGGTTYKTLERGRSVGWSLKGNQKQFKIKGSAANVVYEILLNRSDE